MRKLTSCILHDILINTFSKKKKKKKKSVDSHPLCKHLTPNSTLQFSCLPSNPPPCHLHSQVLLNTNTLHLPLLNFILLRYHCFVKIILNTCSLVLGALLKEMQSTSLESLLRSAAKTLLLHLRKLCRTPSTHPSSLTTSLD